MSISPLSASNAYSALTPSTDAATRPSSFKNLAKSLESGDLAGAQTAFAALQQNAPASATSASGAANPLGDDISAIGKALSSGDLTGAQQAFAKLRDDGQAARSAQGGTQAAGGHHHGGHHGGGAKPASATDAATAVGAPTPPTNDSTQFGASISVKV